MVNSYKAYGRLGMINRLFRVIFPSYRTMCGMPQYHFIVGKPFLLPAAWLYRIGLKWKKRKKLKEYCVTSKDQIDQRLDFLKQWGLD